MEKIELNRAQESRGAIERLYVAMRHLFIRGYYKPAGVSGKALADDLLMLAPEIYGSIDDPTQVELDGLVYVIDRLPKGIEECRFIKLISEEGHEHSSFTKIVPAARKRNCYRIDAEQMFIEITRGRSEIYDLLTHLTFLYIESNKICRHALDDKGQLIREWYKLEEIVLGDSGLTRKNEEIAFTYLSTLLGRTYEETKAAHRRFQANSERNNGLFHIVYWLGKLALDEKLHDRDREVSFSPALRQRIGHHIYGERWANRIKRILDTNGLLDRPLHIISANPHSVLNTFYASAALAKELPGKPLIDLVQHLSKPENRLLMEKVEHYALENGMFVMDEQAGTHMKVQIFDTARIPHKPLQQMLRFNKEHVLEQKPVVVVMDYAFGEQAFECMDELLKPYEPEPDHKINLNVVSISVMGKAGILWGEKGDIMIPTSHVFEGTADNYPFENDLTDEDFKDCGLGVYKGTMITVLGTSLQNKDILQYFRDSSWGAVGLEMEGAHYQKAIQGASKIRNNIRADVKLRYAYYASDNPLETGSTLASGSLGALGVLPTYQITQAILQKILAD